jgi:8-oxo-dGTP diphosphatase
LARDKENLRHHKKDKAMSLASDATAHSFGTDPFEAEMREHGEVKVNVDTVLITMKNELLHVALAPREAAFEKGKLALVGAIMDGSRDADLEAVVARSLRDKAGLEDIYFEQLYTFSGRNNSRGGSRDTRWPSISVTYIALVPLSKMIAANALEHGLRLVPVNEVPALPFDHNDMIEAAVARLRGKGAWSVLPAYLLEEEFTIPELNEVYKKVVGTKSLGQNFRRKVIENNMLELVGVKPNARADRPSEHYRIRPGASTVNTRL